MLGGQIFSGQLIQLFQSSDWTALSKPWSDTDLKHTGNMPNNQEEKGHATN